MRCRSWPTSRCGRRFRRTSSNGCASSGSTGLLQARDDPGDDRVAGVLPRARIGAAHRFGTATMGTAETIKAFTPDDLRAFYASHLPARERDADRRRRRRPATGAAAARERASAAGRRDGRRRRRASRCRRSTQPRRAHGLSRRQAGRAAVADPHRLASACRARRPTTFRFR